MSILFKEIFCTLSDKVMCHVFGKISPLGIGGHIRTNDRQKHELNGKIDLNVLISANGAPTVQGYGFK